MVSFFIVIFVLEIITDMKRLLQIIFSILIGYGLVGFINWDWNITTWEYHNRLCMLLIAVPVWLITILIKTADKTINDESTRNDEIIESYYENKK